MILVFNVFLSILDETLRLFKMRRSEHIVGEQKMQDGG